MSWGSAKAAADAAGEGGGDFLSLKEDGAFAKVVFIGEPFDYEKTWDDGRIQTRIMINVFEVVKKTVAVWDVAPKWFKQVLSAREEWGVNRVYRITRNGTDRKTTYTVVPEPNGDLSEDQQKHVHGLDLIDLAPLASSTAAPAVDPGGPDAPTPEDDDIPF